MKKLLAVMVVLVALVTLVGAAGAGQTYQYKWIPVRFLTNIASGDGVQTDSLAIYRANAADVQDTSAVIYLPSDFVYATAGDSIPEFILRATSTVAGASGDTLHALIQPSVNGTTFTEPTWLVNYGLLIGAVTGGSAPYRLASSYANSANWIDVAPKHGITAVRVRLYADGSAATTGNGLVRVWLGYLSKVTEY